MLFQITAIRIKRKMLIRVRVEHDVNLKQISWWQFVKFSKQTQVQRISVASYLKWTINHQTIAWRGTCWTTHNWMLQILKTVSNSPAWSFRSNQFWSSLATLQIRLQIHSVFWETLNKLSESPRILTIKPSQIGSLRSCLSICWSIARWIRLSCRGSRIR